MPSQHRPTRRSFVVGASFAALAGCSSITSPPPDDQVEDLVVGWRALDATSVEMPTGSLLLGPDLGDWSKGTFLLNVWASWCAPCVKELPLLQKTITEVADWRVVGVSIDQVAGNAKDALRDAGVQYSNVQDPGSYYLESLAPFIPISAVPSSVLVQRGQVVAAHIGPFKSQDDITYARRYLH